MIFQTDDENTAVPTEISLTGEPGCGNPAVDC